jgi:hypothetical protein
MNDTTKPAAALERCPFCGCQARIESNRDWHKLKGDHDDDCVFFAEEMMVVPATEDQLQAMIKDWNRRAPQAEEAPALPTVEEFLARLLPPPGYESHKVIERDGKLMFCLPADIQPTDGLCFYDGDMRDVVKPDTAPKRVQPSIDTSEFRTITYGIRPKDYIEIVAYIDAKLTQARIEVRQESVNRRLALEHRLAKMEDRAIAAEEKLASIRAALDKE